MSGHVTPMLTLRLQVGHLARLSADGQWHLPHRARGHFAARWLACARAADRRTVPPDPLDAAVEGESRGYWTIIERPPTVPPDEFTKYAAGRGR